MDEEMVALESQKNQAYRERNMLLSLCARLARRAGLAAWRGIDPKESPEWQNVIFICLPSGQISFHVHENELEIFEFLRIENIDWDGHDTDLKWKRVLKPGI